MKDHDTVHLQIELPRMDPATSGREFFALWTPTYSVMSDEYLTDANGFDIVTRQVYKNNSGPFSASFYPVTSSITMGDLQGQNSFTVWNDRAQAGSVHKEGGIKLLIDRRVRTNDIGGIPEVMWLF